MVGELVECSILTSCACKMILKCCIFGITMPPVQHAGVQFSFSPISKPPYSPVLIADSMLQTIDQSINHCMDLRERGYTLPMVLPYKCTSLVPRPCTHPGNEAIQVLRSCVVNIHYTPLKFLRWHISRSRIKSWVNLLRRCSQASVLECSSKLKHSFRIVT